MTVDHSEFIARHHMPPADAEAERSHTRKNLIVSGVFVLLYLAGCIALAVIFKINIQMVLVAGLSFIAATILSFFVQRFLTTVSAQEKERQLIREVLEGSRGARLITDGAGNTVYTNQKFDTLCEKGKAGLDALAHLFINNEEARSHFKTLAEQAQRGLTDSIELKSDQDGRERWFLITAQPIAGWAGYVHWRLDDVTEQRELDRSIREEREKLIDFTDNAPVGFFSVDERGRFVFINATLARWLGVSIESALSDGVLHTFIENPPSGVPPYNITEEGGARQVREVMMKGAMGKTFLASINQAVVDEGGGRVRTRGVIHDLTAEREMRQALQASEDRFQRFFEEAPLGIAILSDHGMIEDCNPALAAMMGGQVKDIEGKPFRSLMLENDSATVLSALERMDTSGQMESPIEVTLRQGKEVSVQLFARRFKGSKNIVLHCIDLTKQKELEQKFVQSQKMQAIGQLAGGVAHDFNNLLTAMIGYCDLLLLRHKPGDPSFGDIMQIKQNSNRAANLVRQLLAFSRQQTLRPQVHDVSEILTEISYLIRRLIGANIAFEVMHGQDLGFIKVDVGQMEQVLINLAVNARDAMEQGGKLSIETLAYSNDSPEKLAEDILPPGQWVRIDIRDTGCGIPDSIITRIFEPFFTTKEVGQGTGLGLATVYGIIRQTGGFLDVKSKVGEGTTFTLFLPRLSDEEAAKGLQVEQGAAPESADLTGTARILLVEDEDAVRAFSTRALTNKGYEVLDAESGEKALSIVQSITGKPLDLVITDVIMPQMDGPTLAQNIRKIFPKLKIIFISGYTEDKLKEHMGENIYFLPKPFTLKQLAAKVKDVLDE